MSSASDAVNMIAFRFTASYTVGHDASKHTTYFTLELEVMEIRIITSEREWTNASANE